MFCDPVYCSAPSIVELIVQLAIGLVLMLFAAWFFLRTRVAAVIFGGLIAIARLRAPRPLSRRGRILWVIAAECLILFGFITPALEHLVSPALARALGSLGVASFVVAWIALVLMAVDVDGALENDQEPGSSPMI